MRKMKNQKWIDLLMAQPKATLQLQVSSWDTEVRQIQGSQPKQ